MRHRETTDLALFTVSAEAFERARLVLPHVAQSIGAGLVVPQDSPGFRRVVVQRGSEQLVIDLVRDIGPQLYPKTTIDGIVVDPIEEIFSNKLTTLVSRQDCATSSTCSSWNVADSALKAFSMKPSRRPAGALATLAYLLNEWEIPSNANLPPGYTVDELRVFKSALAKRLLIASHPGSR